MRESDFFNESDVKKPTHLNCPFCGQTFRYEVRWRQRIKKNRLAGASSEDHQRFAKARSYLIRIDDTVRCRNNRCRRRFEIASFQTVVFLSDSQEPPAGRRGRRSSHPIPKRGNQNHR